jgi:hypothetical protein
MIFDINTVFNDHITIKGLEIIHQHEKHKNTTKFFLDVKEYLFYKHYEYNAKQCNRCSACCYTTPWLTENDIINISNSLSISSIDFIKTFCCFYYHYQHIIIALARKNQKDITGAFIPEKRLKDVYPCCFLDYVTCMLHDVKSISCRSQKCWKDYIPLDDNDCFLTGNKFYKIFKEKGYELYER